MCANFSREKHHCLLETKNHVTEKNLYRSKVLNEKYYRANKIFQRDCTKCLEAHSTSSCKYSNDSLLHYSN